MLSFFHDMRLSLRGLARRPALLAITVATLALGIGGNAAIFGVVNTILFRRLPFPDEDRVFRLHMGMLTSTGALARVNVVGGYVDDIQQQDALADAVAMRGDMVSLLGGPEPVTASVVRISRGWNVVFGVRPVLGRYFTAEEEKNGSASRVAIISDSLWKQHFHSDPEIWRQSVSFDNQTYAIVGVFPAQFHFPYRAEIWVPESIVAGDMANDYAVFARLRPGVSPAQFRGGMEALSRHMQAKYPRFPQDQRITVTPSRESLIGEEDRTAVALLALVVFLLLIACVDVAGLLLARSVARRREYALRTALGASRRDHLRSAIAEALSLALLGGGLGLLLTLISSDWLAALVPAAMTRELTFNRVAVDGRVLAYCGALTVLAALLCGIVPLLGAADRSSYAVLKETSGTVTGSQRRRVMLDAFVTGQIALALVLLIGAGLMIENFRRLVNRPLGVDAQHTLTMATTLPRDRYLRPSERTELVRNIVANVSALPGVTAAGISSVNPVYLYSGTWATRVQREGWAETESMVINDRVISPDLLRALGVPLLHGRGFTDRDSATSEPVAIVSQALAKRLWPGQDAIGQHIRSVTRLSLSPWRAVVGVAADVRDAGNYRETWYVPYAQASLPQGDLHLMVRSQGDAAALANSVAATVWKVDRGLPLRDISRLDNLYETSFVGERTGAIAITLFSTFGLILAGVGAFGVMSFLMVQRTHEIGVRLALGADPAAIQRMVLGSGAKLAAIGCALGIAAAMAANRILAAILPEVNRSEPAIFAAAIATLTATTLLACWIPAYRAGRVDPLVALRGE